MATPFSSPPIPNSANQPADRARVSRLQQYEIVWIALEQYALPDHPDGFGLEIQVFLGPGDPDPRGEPTVWVRGAVIGVVSTSAGVRLFRDRLLNVAIPHDQPRARRTGGAVLPPTTPGLFERHDT